MTTKINAWFKAQPPAVQTLLYAIETGVATALAVFLFAVYTASQSAQGFAGFDWKAQIHALAIGVIGALAKALFDFVRGAKPAQIPPPPADTKGPNQ